MSSKASIRTKTYSKFRGVDFSSDPSLVDDSRSPWAPNMVSDAGGMPEKRSFKISYGYIFWEYNKRKTWEKWLCYSCLGRYWLW